MDELLYFDCHASFGPYAKKPLEARWTQEHLLEDMDTAGIAGALVSYSQAWQYDPMRANLELAGLIADHRSRLFPCWMALPALSGEFPEPAEFVEALREHEVRAVRLEPNLFGVPLRQPCWSDLRDRLAGEGVLIVTSMGAHGGTYESVEFIADIFRGCEVLLLGAPWPQWRQVVDLMNTFPRLHLEFSAFQANRAVEYFAGEYGAERCLFGTGLPQRAPGCGRGMFDWSLLAREESQLMAGENLRRLLGGRGPMRIPEPARWHDAITAAVRAGEPLPCLALDAHCHMLHAGGQNAGKTHVMLEGGPEGMRQLATRMGVDRTAVMSWNGPLCADTAGGNRIVAEAVRRHPDHFIGLSTINPEHDSPEQIERVIDEYHVKMRFPGLKTFTLSQNLRYDDPLFDRYFGYANEHHLYAVIDSGGERYDGQIENLARKFPNMSIHLDHCGRSWPYVKWVADMARQFPNIYGQLNYTAATNGIVEYLVGEIGAERVLFGTDAPMRDPRPQGSWLAFTRISEQDKRQIFGLNFASILREAGYML